MNIQGRHGAPSRTNSRGFHHANCNRWWGGKRPQCSGQSARSRSSNPLFIIGYLSGWLAGVKPMQRMQIISRDLFFFTLSHSLASLSWTWCLREWVLFCLPAVACCSLIGEFFSLFRGLTLIIIYDVWLRFRTLFWHRVESSELC